MRKDPSTRSHEILMTARQIVEDSGANALNVQAVTKKLGVSRPLLYHYYNGIEALTAEVVAGYVEDFSKNAENLIPCAQDLSSASEEFVSLVRLHLISQCPLAPHSLETSTASYLSYLNGCSLHIHNAYASSALPFPVAIETLSSTPELTIKSLLFSTTLMCIAQPELTDTRIAQTTVLPYLNTSTSATASDESIPTERKGFFGRIFKN